MEKLFAYGNLREKDVQETVFGRILEGVPGKLVGYAVNRIQIEEEYGIDSYPIITPTQNPDDIIKGILYDITLRELQLVDTYEGKHYKRIQVQLQSNEVAWAFTAAT